MASAATGIHCESSATPVLRHRVHAQLLAGTTSIHEGLLGPKELVPPHTHANEDQCLYVVSGTVHLEIDGEVIEARTGTYVIKPRGLSHAFWKPTITPALVLEITTPGGFESFYDEMAAVRSAGEALAIQSKYGMTFHSERVPELIERHGLQR